jgi:hypothetical protein
MGDRRGAYGVLVGKPERKRPLVRPMHTWKDDIKMDIQEIGCVGIARIGLAQNRNRWQVAGVCVCRNEPSGSMKCGEYLE